MTKRVLIVGLGSIGKRHLRIARILLPNADIRVLRHKTSVYAPEYSNGSFYSLEDALSFAPQLAVIANPAPFHIPVAQALAQIGVHLLVEKPLSTSFVGVSDLIETCRKKDIALLTGYNLRFLPSLRFFRDAIAAKLIGSPLSVSAEIGQYLPSWRPASDYRNCVSAKKELGGGVLLELSHEIDFLRWIFGEIEWVFAHLSRQSQLQIDVEDSVNLILGLSPDSKGARLIGTVNMDFYRHDTTRMCTVIGDKGTLRWNGLSGDVSLYHQEFGEWRSIFSHHQNRDDTYFSEWQNFLACANATEQPVVTGEDGLRVLEIIEAARISSTHCRKVNVASLQHYNTIY